MTAKVSIIFTSFNHKEFLCQAIDSLLGQTFKDFELIVVDDCSTDGSQEILKTYAAKDDRIKLFLNKKNSGSYVYSTNQGAKEASADYIVFAQCDDYAELTQIEKLYNIINAQPNVGVVFSASRMVDADGTKLCSDFDVREKRFKQQCGNDTLIKKSEIERFFLYSCVIPNLSAAMMRRDLFEKQGGLSDKYFVLADWDFWLKTTQECDFYYLTEPLNNFRQHNTTIRASIKLKRQIEEVFRMYYDFFKLTKMGLCKSIRWKYRITKIWFGYAGQGKKAWIQSFFPLFGSSVKYDLCFLFIVPTMLLIAPFTFAIKKNQL